MGHPIHKKHNGLVLTAAWLTLGLSRMSTKSGEGI
jgi:hypothetical protein